MNSTPLRSTITVKAGRSARERLASGPLRSQEIAAIAAAAGGPKGLILNEIDHFLAGEWLQRTPRHRWMIGASIGAWRAAAYCMPTGERIGRSDAFERLAQVYCHQIYSARPNAQEVAQVCNQLITDFLAEGRGQALLTNPLHHLQVLTNRGRGPLQHVLGPAKTIPNLRWHFACATLANLRSRSHLAAYLERWVFSVKPVPWLDRCDAFETHMAHLDEANLHAALRASGSIPLIIDPVCDIPGAKAGAYWDGGIIDYHLQLPYSRLLGPEEWLLYPHFVDTIIPGWLDKALPWRRGGGSWLDQCILIAPSQDFVARLPRRKLPDRTDFKRYGTNHAARIKAWEHDMASSKVLAEALGEFLEQPHRFEVEHL